MTTARQLLDLQITEREFMDTVTRYADLRGWDWHHQFNSLHSKAGWPDLALVRGERLVFAEIKRQTGRLRPEQDYWLDKLRLTGAEVYVWRPSLWGEVEAALR